MSACVMQPKISKSITLIKYNILNEDKNHGIFNVTVQL